MQSSCVADGAGSSPDGWLEAEQEVPAPPYHSINQDPVIPYPVATMGRLVLPPAGFDEPSGSRTLPAVLRRIRRSSANMRSGEEITEGQDSEASSSGVTSEAQRSEQRNVSQRWWRPVEGNESLRMSMSGGGARTPDRLEVRTSPDEEVEASGATPPPQIQHQQRVSYLSQSDFRPGTGTSMVNRLFFTWGLNHSLPERIMLERIFFYPDADTSRKLL
jgi:hypothetical protein